LDLRSKRVLRMCNREKEKGWEMEIEGGRVEAVLAML
jgi:hypothetical protein